MNPIFYHKLKKRLAIFSFGLSALFILLANLYAVSCADIVLMYTALPEILEIIINVLECGIYGIAYAILIYAAYAFTPKKLPGLIAIYGGSVVFKYIANFLVTWITDTGMSAEYLAENLSYVLIYIGIELVQALLILLVIYRTMKRYHDFIARQQKVAATLPDTTVTPRTYAFPFTKLFSLKNPLQTCAFWSGVTVSSFKVISRLIFDISYGMPADALDALWMLLYYLFDLFAGFAICLLITYLLMSFDRSEQKNA